MTRVGRMMNEFNLSVKLAVIRRVTYHTMPHIDGHCSSAATCKHPSTLPSKPVSAS